jgi:hypothetical protein
MTCTNLIPNNIIEYCVIDVDLIPPEPLHTYGTTILHYKHTFIPNSTLILTTRTPNSWLFLMTGICNPKHNAPLLQKWGGNY